MSVEFGTHLVWRNAASSVDLEANFINDSGIELLILSVQQPDP